VAAALSRAVSHAEGRVTDAVDRSALTAAVTNSPLTGLCSLDLFRCESAILHTHGVLVVMDQCTRRIVGFGVHRGVVDGVRCARCSIGR
jgi:hypothetical protein